MNMVKLRMFRRLESIKMLSVRRFQKLLIGYFATVILIVILYVSFYGNGSQARNDDVSTLDDREIPFIVELNSSDDELADSERALLKRIELDLEAMAKLNAIRAGEKSPVEFNEKLPSDEELEMMMDALKYARPTRPGGHPPIEQNGSTTVTPDYFMRSIAYTPDGEKVTSRPAGDDSLEGAESRNVSDVVYYDVDKDGAMYDEILADYGDDTFKEIPHILHQTWDSTLVPSQISPWVSSWLQYNPYWVHWFWTDHGFMDLLLHHFPEYYDIYRKYDHKVNKADMRKYFLMYKEGGIVADLDLECVRHFDDTILENDCILAQEPIVHRELLYGAHDFEYVTPAFMACRAEHPFFKYVIENLRPYAERSHAFDWNDQVLNSTGTMFLSQVYHDYKKLYGKNDVYVAPAELFMPAYDTSFETKLRVKCNGYKLDNTLSYDQKRVCEGLTQTNFANFRTDKAYTYHHWSKSWAEDHQLEENVDFIQTMVPTITIFDR